MIKIILTLLIITTINASDIKLESSIFNKLVSAVTKKTDAKVYFHKNIESLNKYPGELKVVTDCTKADMVILSTNKDIPATCKGKILFGTRYSHLKNKEVIGAFFWQKGRPNILFYEKRLKKNNIKLDSSFDKYIEN